MALRIFSQTPVSGKFDTGANWVGGVAPTNGDSWIIDGVEGTPLEQNIDDGLDQSANTFVNGVLGKNYKGQFGNSTTAPFKGGFSGVLAIEGGASEHYIDSSSKTIADARFNGCGVDGMGELYLLGTITKCTVARGILHPWSGTWGELHQAAAPGSSAAQVFIRNADIASIYGFNGYGEVDIESTTGRIRNLTNASATWKILAGQLDAASIAGGSVAYNSLTAISGAILVHGGEFALTNVQAQTVARLAVFGAGRIRINQGLENDVITLLENHGGGRLDGALS